MLFLKHGHMKYRLNSNKLRGKANLYATIPTHSGTSNGPMYRGLSLPFFLNVTPLMGDTLRRIFSPIRNVLFLPYDPHTSSFTQGCQKLALNTHHLILSFLH